MDLHKTPDQLRRGDASLRTGLRTIVFTDIVGSTDLKHRLGDARAVQLIESHHKLLRQELAKHETGREVSTAGDSFLLVFEKPSEAVRFAVLLHRALGGLSRASGEPVADRVGIHVGEVVITEAGGAGKPHDYYGIHVDLCARVMSLANPGQTLLTRFAYDNAKQVLRGRNVHGISLRWVSHGLYQLKGLADPVEICEVGDERLASRAPAASEKGQRCGPSQGETAFLARPTVPPPPPPPPPPAQAPMPAEKDAVPRGLETICPAPAQIAKPASSRVAPVPRRERRPFSISLEPVFGGCDALINGVFRDYAGTVRANKALLFAVMGFIGAALGAACAELMPRFNARQPVNTAVWTAVAATGLTLALWLTNEYYLRRRELSGRSIAKVVFGAALAGLFAGGFAEWIYGAEHRVYYWREIFFRPTCWGVMGALIGWRLRVFLPSLTHTRGIGGGIVGGVIGGFAFLFTAVLFPQTLGRIVGFGVMGAAFGLAMIAADALFREAILEVCWARNETTTIPLGARPVFVGGGDDHVPISGLPEHAIAISLEDGRIHCANRATGQVSDLKDGSSIKIGPVELVVRAKASPARMPVAAEE